MHNPIFWKHWMMKCGNRKKSPTFNFDQDEADTASKADILSGNLIKRIAKKIHEAGGCDARDEYSRGYDAAIAVALDIIMEETGFAIEDIVDYEEGKGA